MFRFTPTVRWLIAALLAVWVPVCCCEASGLVGFVWDAVRSEGGDGGTCCCCAAEDGDHPATPADHDGEPCDGGCCALAVKMPGSPRPDVGGLGGGHATVLPPPVAVVSCCIRPDPLAAATRREARPTPALTLLRLHCALTV